MDRMVPNMLAESSVEILPPVREDTPGPDRVTCLCCHKARSLSSMDDDGCGICDECLAP